MARSHGHDTTFTPGLPPPEATAAAATLVPQPRLPRTRPTAYSHPAARATTAASGGAAAAAAALSASAPAGWAANAAARGASGKGRAG